MTIQYRVPVRLAAPQVFNYTFKDQNKVVIPLTDYVSVALHLKLQGLPEATPVAAVFVGPKANGQVQSVQWTPPAKGSWSAQFIAVDGFGNELPGEPSTLQVYSNVPDLGINELPNY